MYGVMLFAVVVRIYVHFVELSYDASLLPRITLRPQKLAALS